MKRVSKMIIKIVLTIILISLPIVVTFFASRFVDAFCPYFGYRKMEIASNFVPMVATIYLFLSIVCLAKIWVIKGTMLDD